MHTRTRTHLCIYCSTLICLLLCPKSINTELIEWSLFSSQFESKTLHVTSSKIAIDHKLKESSVLIFKKNKNTYKNLKRNAQQIISILTVELKCRSRCQKTKFKHLSNMLQELNHRSTQIEKRKVNKKLLKNFLRLNFHLTKTSQSFFLVNFCRNAKTKQN